MSGVVVGLALFAAILHASWNAFLRNGADRLWTVTVMSFASTVLAVPFVLVHPLPASPAWVFIALSAVLQVGYTVFLVAAYRDGELGQIYPVVRGTAPLLVTLGNVAAGEHLGPNQLIGVALVATGIMSLAFGKGPPCLEHLLCARCRRIGYYSRFSHGCCHRPKRAHSQNCPCRHGPPTAYQAGRGGQHDQSSHRIQG